MCPRLASAPPPVSRDAKRSASSRTEERAPLRVAANRGSAGLSFPLTRGRGWAFARPARTSPEDPLREGVQAVPPVRPVVGVAVHVPRVRDVVLLQVGVYALAHA